MANSNAEKVIRQALEAEQRNQFDLDNFITDFEHGFPRFEKINPLLKEHYWGQGISHRPRIKELNEEADAQQIEGYRLIEFFPDREDKEESYLLFGTPIELMTQLVIIMNFHLMMRNRTIGEWVGYPLSESARLPPSNSLTARILLLTNQHGDQNRRGLGYKSQRQITIPEIDKTTFTYANLRKACGENKGLRWGDWSSRAYVSLDNVANPYHQIVAGGDSQDQARKNLDAFLKFSQCKLRNRSDTELDFSSGYRTKDPYKAQKKKFQVYPGYLIIFNARLVEAPKPPTRGKPTNKGKQLRTKIKLPLFYSKEPQGWSSSLAEIFKRAT